MPRDVNPLLLAALAATPARLAVLVEVQFAASTLRLWSGNGPIIWNEQVYLGNGWLTGYTPSSDTQEIRAEGFTVTLTSVPIEVVALILNEARQSLSGKLYLAALDSAGLPIPDPCGQCEGFIDVPEFAEDGDTASVQLSFESDIVDLDQPNETRYTDGEQQRLFPGDKALEHVAGLQDIPIFWGIPGDIPRE